MNIEVADTSVATMVAAAATRKMVGSRAEPDPVPLLNAEDIKTALLRVDMPLFRDLASGNKAEVVSGVRPVRGDEKCEVEKMSGTLARLARRGHIRPPARPNVSNCGSRNYTTEVSFLSSFFI